MREWLDGEDEINPPIQFPPPEFGGPVVTFSSWSEVSGMCGDSRVWGGLHFEVNEESFACAQGLRNCELDGTTTPNRRLLRARLRAFFHVLERRAYAGVPADFARRPDTQFSLRRGQTRD